MVFLPADVARLVLDYLGSEGYEKTCDTFLLECNHVAAICDYIDQSDADIKDLLPLTDKSLNNILHEYSVNKLTLKRKLKHKRQTSFEDAESGSLLNPFEPRSQSGLSYRRLQHLRAQQIKEAKTATLTEQSTVVPISISKTYSEIQSGAVVVDPPDTSCRQVQRSSDVSNVQNAESQLPHASTLNCTTVATESSPVATQTDRVVKHPADFSYARDFQFLENSSTQAKLNNQSIANQDSDEAEAMEYYDPPAYTPPANQTSPAKKKQKTQRTTLVENLERPKENESYLHSGSYVSKLECRRQNTLSFHKLRVLRAKQAKDKEAKTATLTEQSPVVPICISKTYSDIPSGAIVVDPPDTFCPQVQRSSDVSIGQNAKLSQLLQASTLNCTTTATEHLPKTTQGHRVVKHPADFSCAREFHFLENLSHQSKLNIQSAANRNIKEPEPMEYALPAYTSPTNQLSTADEEKQQASEKEIQSLKVKSVEEPNLSLADEDIREFPTLLEKLLNDSNLQQKLAENINKALPSDNNQPIVSTPFKTEEQQEVENPKIFSDSFLDAHLSEDTIHDIVEMTAIDPAFEGLFNLFNVSKQDFLQENLQQKERESLEDQVLSTNQESNEQNQSPTKPSFLFNECSNSAMIPNSPEKATTSFQDKALCNQSSEKHSKILANGDQSLDFADTAECRQKTLKPDKTDMLGELPSESQEKKIPSQSPTKPSCTVNECNNSAVVQNSPEKSFPAKSSMKEPKASEKDSIAVAKEDRTNEVPDNTGHRRKSRKPAKKDVLETSSILMMTSLTPKKTDSCARTSPYMARKSRNIQPSRSESESYKSPKNSKLSHSVAVVSGESNTSVSPPMAIKKQSPANEPKRLSETVVELSKEIRDITIPSDTNRTDTSSKKSIVEDGEEIPSVLANEYKDISAQKIDCSGKVGISDLKYFETFPDTDEPVDQLSCDAIAECVLEVNAGGNKRENLSETLSDETENVTTVSIAASILASAMQESRSPIKMNQKEDNCTAKKSPEKAKQVTIPSIVASSHQDISTSNKQTDVSSNGFSDGLKTSEIETKTDPPVQTVELSVPPTFNISLKSQPSQVIYSCPVEGFNGNNSVIRQKKVTDDTQTIIVMDPRKKIRSNVPGWAQPTHIRPPDLQLPSGDQVINIPCLIDPLLIGSSGNISTSVPVTYVPYDGDSNHENSNIFEKLSNFPILPVCQPIDSSSQPVNQIVPAGQQRTVVNVVPSWQFANSNQANVITNHVPSRSEIDNACGQVDSAPTGKEKVVNGKKNAKSSTKIVSGHGKKSNRSSRRIRPIPVSSEQCSQNTAFTSAVEVQIIDKKNTKKLQTIDLMDLQSIQNVSPQGCVNIMPTPVKVIVKTMADGVTSFEEVSSDNTQSSACPDLQVSLGSATKAHSRSRKQDLSKESHVRILDFDEEISIKEPKKKLTKARKSNKKSDAPTRQPIPKKTSKKSPPKNKKSNEVKEQKIIKTKTPTKLGEDLPLKKRPILDTSTTSQFFDKSPNKLNVKAQKSPSKSKSTVRRSPRRKTQTDNPKSPRSKIKKSEESKTKQTLPSQKSPRKSKATRKSADKIKNDSPSKKDHKLKSSLKQTESPQELKRVSFGEVDSITVNSPEVSHNIDEEVNEAAQLLMDMASYMSPNKNIQEAGRQVVMTEPVTPETKKPVVLAPEVVSPRKSPRKNLAVNDDDVRLDKKRKRDEDTEKSKKSNKKRKGFLKNMDVDKFLSGLQYSN
ncbi:protein NPAT-like [Anneissia japonica]|uniref:protein NPAT-like n=1 Tax=Anneissia japonica TaxID=1529436 RepID=UPI0014259FF9|nr:protein NPAT-like [Anneissia japonica]